MTQTHTSYQDICNNVTGGVEMLCHRKSRSVVAHASQMLTNATPEISLSFADVDMGALRQEIQYTRFSEVQVK